MGVRKVKSDLQKITNDSNTIINNCNSVIDIIEVSNSLTSIRKIISPCNVLFNSCKEYQNTLFTTYIDINNSLEILLKDLASEIYKIYKLCKSVLEDITGVKEIIEYYYTLGVTELGTTEIFSFDNASEDLKEYTNNIRQLITDCTTLKHDCNYWNREIVIKR